MSQDAKIALRLDDAIPGLEALDGVVSISSGIFDEATNMRTGGLVAEYAIHNEFGTQHIPARPAMRATLEAFEDSYVNGFADLIMQGLGPETAAEILSQQMEGDIKKSIADWVDPPNSPATQKHKQRSDGTFVGPLKDTGAYLSAISSRVDKG